MSRPPDRAQSARLRQLAQLARLQADRETARLGETARARGRILAALDALGRGEAPLGPETPVDPRVTVPPGLPLDDPVAASGGTPVAASVASSVADLTAHATQPAPDTSVGARPIAAPAGHALPPQAQPAWPSSRPAHQPEAGADPAGDAAGGLSRPARDTDLSARAIPALVMRARLAHRAWIEARRAELQIRLARIEADWHRLRPGAARAFGRAAVLGDLADSAERQVGQRHADSREDMPAPADLRRNRRP
jgi:hypothetical protein